MSDNKIVRRFKMFSSVLKFSMPASPITEQSTCCDHNKKPRRSGAFQNHPHTKQQSHIAERAHMFCNEIVECDTAFAAVCLHGFAHSSDDFIG